MIEFDLIQLTLPPRSVANDILLANSANWEVVSIRQISVRILEVDLACQVINRQFNIKTKPWQVSIVVDITKWKWDIYIIASTNTSKNLVYQLIQVIISDFVLVISSTIVLIKD